VTPPATPGSSTKPPNRRKQPREKQKQGIPLTHSNGLKINISRRHLKDLFPISPTPPQPPRTPTSITVDHENDAAYTGSNKPNQQPDKEEEQRPIKSQHSNRRSTQQPPHGCDQAKGRRKTHGTKDGQFHEIRHDKVSRFKKSGLARVRCGPKRRFGGLKEREGSGLCVCCIWTFQVPD
jgi:hypothetical protein